MWGILCTVCVCGLSILSASVGLCVYVYVCIVTVSWFWGGEYVFLCVHLGTGSDGTTAGKAPLFIFSYN